MIKKEKKKKKRTLLKRIIEIVIITIGWSLVIIGTAGIFLPIIPGWLLIFIGLNMVGSPLVIKIKRAIKERSMKIRKSINI